MHAIIETGSKQYRVTLGDTIFIEKLASAEGEKVTFPVLLLEGDAEVKVGRPVVDGAVVTGEIIDQKKDKKILAYVYRKRKGSERKIGHRQPLTVVKITDIKG